MRLKLWHWLGLAAAVALLTVGLPAWTRISTRAMARRWTGGDPAAAPAAFRAYGCASCHTIPGVAGAHALVGPPLSDIGDRMVIAGVLPNTPENLERWIEHPHSVVPNVDMPEMGVTPADAKNIAAYLYSLR